MSSVTSTTDGKHSCQICGYQTFKKALLKLHWQAVHGGKTFQCQQCGYQATKKSNVVRHHQVTNLGQSSNVQTVNIRQLGNIVSLHMGLKFECPEC